MLNRILAAVGRRNPALILKLRYFRRHHKWLDLDAPIERMPNLITYILAQAVKNRANKHWAMLADKYAVRQYVTQRIGAGHLIPLVAKWDSPADIDFAACPRSFVMKTNNGCGDIVFVHDKTTADRAGIAAKFARTLRSRYAEASGQLHYGLIKPCVIADALMEQGGGHKSLTDYKVCCVNGTPRAVLVFEDRDEVNHFDYRMNSYTSSWQLIPPGKTPADVADAPVAPGKPEAFDEMLRLAGKLAQGLEYVRVDMYIVGDKVYFGEMTLTPDAAFNPVYHIRQPLMTYLLDCIRADRRAKKS